MKKILLFCFFILFCQNSFAEIIDNIQKKEQTFGDWKVICEEDVMMDDAKCKAFAKFYKNLGTVYIQPHNQIANQVVIIMPQAVLGTDFKVRVDDYKIIKSKSIVLDNYGVIPFSSKDQKEMFRQMQDGENFFLRFFVKEGKNKVSEEVTVKISLAEFNKMLIYYDKKMGN